MKPKNYTIYHWLKDGIDYVVGFVDGDIYFFKDGKKDKLIEATANTLTVIKKFGDKALDEKGMVKFKYGIGKYLGGQSRTWGRKRFPVLDITYKEALKLGLIENKK